jgi:hypothetical protein
LSGRDPQLDDATPGLEAKRRVLRDLRVRDDAAVSGMQIDQLLQGMGFAGQTPPAKPPRPR